MCVCVCVSVHAHTHTHITMILFVDISIDWMPQAQYHAESAKNIMLGGVHLSNSSAEKPLIMEVLITINYVLGRALTMLKKYPFIHINHSVIIRIGYTFLIIQIISDKNRDI